MKVLFLPSGTEIETARGRTLLAVAKEHSLPLHYECDGMMTCATCAIEIIEGEEHLTPASEEELLHLSRQKLSEHHRLSCQARILGNTVVKLRNEPK